MTTSRTLPNDSNSDVVTFTILVDGQAIDSGYQVVSVLVSKVVNRIPSAKLTLIDGDAAEETFPLSNKDEFVPGKEISIKAGRDGDDKLIFKGIITKHRIKVRSNGQSNLLIEAKDEAIKMTIGRHSKYFEKKKDSEVIEEIIGTYSGLTKDVETTDLKHQELVQHHVTDWDFVLSRADVNGKLVMVDDGKVQIKTPDTSQAAVLDLLYGATLLEFEAEMDARTQWKSVKATSWDYSSQKIVEATSSSTSFTEHGNIEGSTLADTIDLKELELQHSGKVQKEELEAWAKAAVLKSRLAKIQGRAKIMVGNADVKPGTMVNLQGVGDRFNGKAFVSGIRHEIVDGQWDTQIQFGLSPEWFAQREHIMPIPASGLVPAVSGLQIGIVVQLEKDPDNEHRILVKLPILDANATGIWARVSTLDAGKNRGSFFLPEIDDEVIVGFINGDPRDAIVLGMVHSSQHPAPIEAKDTNHEKAIITRENMRIHFNDEDKTISIDTPEGNSIVLDEKSKSILITDQNKNKITLDENGIVVDSPKDITIKAGAAINVKATTDLKLEGVNITVKASGALKMEGATAKLASPGITEIKGSLVKVN